MVKQTDLEIEETHEFSREDLVSKIKLCEDRRIDLDVLDEIFSEVGIYAAQRWLSLQSEAKTCSDVLAKKLDDKISNLLKNHIFFDNKLVMVYDQLTIDDVDFFTKGMIEVFSNDSSFDDSAYIANGCYEISDSIVLYNFKIHREIQERKELTAKDLGEKAIEVFDKYNRIVGYSPIAVDCLDAMLIDTLNKRLILQLDLGSIVLANAVDKFFHDFRTALNDAFVKVGVKNCRIPEKTEFVNLYSSIQNYYDNPEGEVTDASFSTSKNNHREYIKEEARDIRKADYHSNGKLAEEKFGGKIRPYRISKRFERILNTWPQVYVGVHHRYFANDKSGFKSLYQAHIFDIKSREDYDFIIEKILANR